MCEWFQNQNVFNSERNVCMRRVQLFPALHLTMTWLLSFVFYFVARSHSISLSAFHGFGHFHLIQVHCTYPRFPWYYPTIISSREMRCIRHKVHIALFIAFGLADLAWILQLMCQVRNYPKTLFIYQFMLNCAQNIIKRNMTDIVRLYCTSWVATLLFTSLVFIGCFIITITISISAGF